MLCPRTQEIVSQYLPRAMGTLVHEYLIPVLGGHWGIACAGFLIGTSGYGELCVVQDEQCVEDIFKGACTACYLGIAESVIRQYADQFSLSTVCWYANDLRLAQVAYSLGAHDVASGLRWACYHGNMEMIEWLCQLPYAYPDVLPYGLAGACRSDGRVTTGPIESFATTSGILRAKSQLPISSAMRYIIDRGADKCVLCFTSIDCHLYRCNVWDTAASGNEAG